MTRDDILRMAGEAELKAGQHWDKTNMDTQHIERFAALIAAAERAACADICEQHATCEGVAQLCAAAIRARGNT
jgi:hypothetical protein